MRAVEGKKRGVVFGDFLVPDNISLFLYSLLTVNTPFLLLFTPPPPPPPPPAVALGVLLARR